MNDNQTPQEQQQDQKTTLNPDDFKMKLATELADKPELFQDILNFQEKIHNDFKQLQENQKQLQEALQIKEKEVQSKEEQLGQVKNFNALLMAKIPFDTFAPTPQQKVDPMQNFLKGLDEAGMKKTWNF